MTLVWRLDASLASTVEGNGQLFLDVPGGWACLPAYLAVRAAGEHGSRARCADTGK